ncbi:MAG: helix-turn-helix domain-containing protein [Oscillospiraceae bacterium]|jgi:YesN/AraC family two-component response regulator|nr:helix-turn-helix domain-containing protein [Oscillospiraceae bacterium]
MLELLKEKCVKYQKHFSELLEIGCKIVDISDGGEAVMLTEDPKRNFCAHCRYDKKDELTTHLYGCHEARRWNGKYIYYCPLGLTFIAASISNERGELTAGVVLGPIVMGDLQDTLYDLPVPEMSWAVSQLSVFSTQKVQHIQEIFVGVMAHISDSEQQKIQNLLYDQEKALKDIYVAKDYYKDSAADDLGQNADTLLKFEKNLRMTVINGEKSKALDSINEVLAHIYVYSNFDLAAIKARLLELLVILSRATIEAGANPKDTFRLSEDFISQIEQYSDVDQLAFWISDIVRRFVVQAFDLAQIKHSDVVFKITNHIKKNCAEKLSLDLLAREVYLSKSYLSSIFKQETGMSLTEYITKVRVEKSKRLLTEENISLSAIASQCGFKDQSYFTKVFKKETGKSPKKFRNNASD